MTPLSVRRLPGRNRPFTRRIKNCGAPLRELGSLPPSTASVRLTAWTFADCRQHCAEWRKRRHKIVSETGKQLVERMAEKYGPIPESFVFGDGIDWNSPLEDTMLYVELPFWLMMPPGPVDVEWSGRRFTVHVCPQWMEVFAGDIRDSRQTVVHHGPWIPNYSPPEPLAEALNEVPISWMERGCKTVLRLAVRAHSGAFRALGDGNPPRAAREREAYWASLCEAHLPVVNELIQRYRLVTYDFFAYEVSAWDVPVWFLKHAGEGYRAVLLPYKAWDSKPVVVEDGEKPSDPPRVTSFQWATTVDLEATSSETASAGEFDLLDARSLMERGDYTGAVRRTVTAIEAILRSALLAELDKKYPTAEAESRTARTDTDFPGRLAQWRKLAKPSISQMEFDEFETTRTIRHQIVHRGRRLVHDERWRAQRAVDTGRWLYNKIEAKPARAKLRDYGVLKSVGRVALTPRFPSSVGQDGITVSPIPDFNHPDSSPTGPDDERA